MPPVTEDHRMKKTLLLSALTVALTFSSILGAQAAESPEEFYKDNKATMIIGTGPGGASDVGARLFAKYWNQVTGGEMQVKNMPGAGGVVALNYLANSAKPDGLTMNIMMFNCAYQMPYLQKSRAAKFDPTKFNYIIGGFQEPWILLASKKYSSLDELKAAKELRYGALSPIGESTFAALPVLQGLSLNARIVTGYKSQTEVELAVGKSELDFTLSPLSQGMRAVDQGLVSQPMLVVGEERTPVLPDVPCLTEVADLTPEQKQLLESSMSIAAINRIAAFPAGVPEDRVAYVRKAMEKIVTIPEFNEDAKKVLLLGATPMTGKELDNFVTEAFSLDYQALIDGLEPYLKK